jgi:endonuclease/exonuclease/phosphatase family metal-dependent hydrolase
MKKTSAMILIFGIIFLFFIQLSGTLVESIYILDLMNTSLDEKALGVLFYFTPLLLIPFFRKSGMVWITFAILLLARGLLPYLSTANRLMASGIGTFAVLGLLFLVLAARRTGETPSKLASWGSAGLALGLSLSVLLRTLYFGLDYSLSDAGGWVGWGLALLLGISLLQLGAPLGAPNGSTPAVEPQKGGVTAAILGIYMVLTLSWFSFSAPAVIARWTEGSYPLIVITTSLFSVGWIAFLFLSPHWIERIGKRALLVSNLAFTLSLAAVLLVHRVPFPLALDSAPVVVAEPGWLAQALLGLMLLLFPVIFLDMRVFVRQFVESTPTPRQLVPGILLAGFVLLLLVFANIFSNVWGYVEPVSPPFRNTFWLAYVVMAGIITLLAWRSPKMVVPAGQATTPTLVLRSAWVVLLAVIFFATAVRALPAERVRMDGSGRTSLVVMTFNTQQSNDESAERSFDEQLSLIRRVSPDILALQESDSTRISLNNNDYVRYFTENLGYYAYYGPTTGTGTFGTALLSKYPLLNTRTVFIYSDQDETAITEAEIEVGGLRFTIYNVHPDGSDAAMLAFADTLLDRSKDKPFVIALGDYNLRDHEEAYQCIDSVFTNAWVSVYPTEISPEGVDMSGNNRIDHIFVSRVLGVNRPVYVLPPNSATDHPVHWAEIFWQTP